MNQTNPAHSTQMRDFYLGIYGGLGFGQAVAVVFGSLFLYLATLQVSISPTFHEQFFLHKSVLRTFSLLTIWQFFRQKKIEAKAPRKM
jgi:hypothetical protein